jgi:hypothetical protein
MTHGKLKALLDERRALDVLSAMRAETDGDPEPMRAIRQKLVPLNSKILTASLSMYGKNMAKKKKEAML